MILFIVQLFASVKRCSFYIKSYFFFAYTLQFKINFEP